MEEGRSAQPKQAPNHPGEVGETLRRGREATRKRRERASSGKNGAFHEEMREHSTVNQWRGGSCKTDKTKQNHTTHVASLQA